MPTPPARIEPAAYDGVVFAGGGCRCFWQAGFWSVASAALDLRPRVVGAVSAGSAMACAAAAGVLEGVLETMKRRTASNPRNLYLGNWRTGRPVFPHEQIYRQTILEHLAETELERIHAGPEVRVLIARPRGWGPFPRWPSPSSPITSTSWTPEVVSIRSGGVASAFGGPSSRCGAVARPRS